jgi:protein-disulfide isomerase
MPETTAVSPQPKKRSVWPTVLTLAVLVGVGIFVWRVVHYMRLIQSGEIIDAQASYYEEMSISRIAAASAVVNPNVDVVTQDDPSLGSEDAALTIVEFADFGCPYSRQVSFLMRSLAHEYGDRIRYVYRDFPLTDIHPQAFRAAEAGECADDQGKFWEMHDKMYQNQSDLSDERLIEHARSLGLDMGRFLACFNNGVHTAEVQTDYDEGLGAGVYGTPTFFLNGNKVDGAIPADVLRALIEQLTAPSEG